jgi:diguanylate cyclase (GGDEF)-like protein
MLWLWRAFSTAWRCFLAGFCVSSIAAVAMASDAPPLVLEHLTTADGLPQGTVYTVLQDSQGFMWLGTEDGLVRYDGHEIVRYAYSRSARNGLPGNFVYQVVEDAHHDLWIALKDAGLARWNRSTDTFTVFRHNARHPNSLSSDAARAVLIDRQGRIWLGTSDAGLDILDPRTGRITHLRHSVSDPSSLADDRIVTLALDRSGRVWVGMESGLDRWDAARGLFLHYRHDPKDAHSLSGNQVTQVHQDATGVFWVGTFDGGLDRMDLEGDVTRVFRSGQDDVSSLASDEVQAILEDQAGHLWVGTSDGLDLLDRGSGQIVHYRTDAHDPDSLRDSDVMSLYEDPAGLVWIGTRTAGVSRWNPRSWEFGGRRPQWLSGKPVTSFAEAAENKVWIGSLGGGLIQFDTDTGRATPLDSLLNRSDAIGDKRVMSLLKDRRGDLWIGTMADGLFVLTSAGKLTAIPVRPGDSSGVSASGIMTLFESGNGAIWIGTYGGGANILDPVTRQVRHLPFQPGVAGSTEFPNVSAFAEDSRGNVWIGTDGGGLALARPDGTVVKLFRHDPHDLRTLPANTVYALAVDSQDRVWVGTDGGGLARVVGSPESPDSIQFQVITRDQGLSSDTIYGVVPDLGGHLWLSGNAGLVRYDPRTGAIKTYHRQHGLQGEEFDFNAYHRLRDGRLCFGGPGGFNIFDPARLTESHIAPRLALTRVSVMGVPVTTEKPSWLLGRLNLGYRANIVSLDFGALDFTSPNLNRLAYRMSGLTDHWIDLGTQRRLTLTNLEAGDHLLEVRAASADSVWSETPLKLLVHRDPAPWRSTPAYAIYVLVVLALVAYRLYSQREKFRRITEHIVQVRTLVDALPDRLWVVDAAGRIQWSPQAQAGEGSTELGPPKTLPEIIHAIGQTAQDGRQRKLEYREMGADGTRRSYEMRFTRREGGDVVVTRQDTSERMAAAEHIERLAYVDTLTGLPNRQRCLETAESLFADARISNEKVAVLYLDLNNFKRVNDTLGHSIGDEVLRTASRRLEQALEPIRLRLPHVSIARVGGDEFVALLRNPGPQVSAMSVAQTFCAAFEAPISQNGLDFYCAPSIGVAMYPDDGVDVTTVFKHADTAMYHAKTGASGSIAVYTAAMSSRLRDWLDLESRLRHAVQDDALRLYFQPKFNLRDNRLVGVEALLRWCDPEHGEISPARFIEIAEDSGLIIDIGAWVTRVACRHLRRWLDAGHRLPIAINVSAKELLYGDPATVVETEAAAAGIPPSLIEIEITESLLVKDSISVQGALQRLRQLGCRIALDDFGTGYSSLAYITRFPPDRIKIDKAFVRNVDRSASDAAIASTILSLGASLDLTVTAEGVERAGQFEWLRARGCHEVQGFLLSPALPAAEFEQRFLFSSARLALEREGRAEIPLGSGT